MKNKLLQLLSENARADRATPSIRGAADGDAHAVYVYDVIDSYWGASAQALVEALAGADGRTVHMHINSPGGDVFEARAMVSAVRAMQSKGGKVVTYIDGLAASAATYLALAGDEVHIADGGMFMVHNSWTISYGDKTEFRATADLLDKIDGTIAADYQRKTGATAAQVTAWMDAETWFTGAEALDAGFVDSVIEPPKATGSKASRWNLAAYANAPKLLEPAAGHDADIAAHAANVQRLNRSRLAALLTRT